MFFDGYLVSIYTHRMRSLFLQHSPHTRVPSLVENFSSLFSLTGRARTHTHMHAQAHCPKFMQSQSLCVSTSTLYALRYYILFSSNSFGSRIRFFVSFHFSFVRCVFNFCSPSLCVSRILFLSMEAWPLAPSLCFNSIKIIRCGLNFVYFVSFRFQAVHHRPSAIQNNLFKIAIDAHRRICKFRFASRVYLAFVVVCYSISNKEEGTTTTTKTSKNTEEDNFFYQF